MQTRNFRHFPIASAVAAVCLAAFAGGLLPRELRAAGEDPIAALRQRQRKVVAVLEKALPATVAIVSRTTPASGSGVVVSKDGLILTAAHVTQAAGEELNVIFPDGRQVEAKSLGANRSRDAGMAQITTAGEYPFVEMGSTKSLDLGAWCVALGHPGGYDSRRTPPVRIGRVWSKKTVFMLGSDCTLVGGDSGGPLFDLDGKLIGIHSSIGGGLAENRHVPIEVFRANWDMMLAGEIRGSIGFLTSHLEPDQPVLGVNLEDVESGDGISVRIADILDHSPAAAAGLLVGDRVLTVDGENVTTTSALQELLKQRAVGDTLRVSYEREGKPGEATVTLAAAETLDFGNPFSIGPPEEPSEETEAPADAGALFGVMLDRNLDTAEVIELIPDSPASHVGIVVGDVIAKVGDTLIGGPQAMIDAIATRNPGDSVRVLVRRGEDELTFEVTLAPVGAQP